MSPDFHPRRSIPRKSRKIGIKTRRKNSLNAHGTELTFGKERVHPEGSLKSASLVSAILSAPFEARAMLPPTSKLQEERKIRDWFRNFNAQATRIWAQMKRKLYGDPDPLPWWWRQTVKWKQTRRHKCMFTILVPSWLWNHSRICLQFYRLENFAKTQVCEFGDIKTRIYFIGAAQYVELFLFARHEWLRKPGTCGGWTRQCSHTHLETHTEHESLSNRTFSRVETGTDSTKFLETRTKKRRRTYLETKAKQREFALNVLLETECSHVQIRKRIWYGAEPDASLHGKSFTESAEEVGNHGRIISQRIGANSDEHIHTGIIHARFNAGSHPSWTKKHWERGSLQERARGRDQEFIQHYTGIGVGTFWRDPGCAGHRQQGPIMEKTKNISSTGGQVDKGKKSTYTQTRSYVLENCLHYQMQQKGGKGSSWIFRQQFQIKNSTESTENLLSESGIFSQDLLHWQFFGRFRIIYRTATLSLRILEIELSWCPCSTTLIGTRKTMKESVFQNPERSEIMRRDFRKDIGRSWAKTCGEIAWKLFLQAWRKIEFRSSTHATTILRRQIIQFLQVSVRWTVEFWKEWKAKRPYISQRKLQALNSHSGSFTLQISSVCTGQCEAGVESLVQTRLSLSWRSSWQVKNPSKRYAEECEFTGNKLSGGFC